MMAADHIAAINFWERARRWLTTANVLVVGCCTVALVTFLAGRSIGEAKERGRMADSVRKVLADSSKVIEQRLSQRAIVLAVAQRAQDSASFSYRATVKADQHAATNYATDRAKVVVTSDTSLTVGGNTIAVPSIVTELIARADSLAAENVHLVQSAEGMQRADSTAMSLALAQLADMTADRNTWRDRATLDEAQHGSRFGFKSGVATGAAIVGLIVHFLR